MSTTPNEPIAPAAPAAPAATEDPKPTPTTEPRTFTQAELDQIIEKRLGKYRDYDEIKAKASKFDEAEEAAKSELQKERERAERAESEAMAAKREAFAATKGMPVELITGSTQEEWDAAAAKALEWKGAQADPTPPPPVPTAHAAGNNGVPAGSPGDIDAQIAEAEKAHNFSLAIALKQRKFAAAQAH